MHLYVHVPFCARRCSYCDFAIAVRKAVPSEAYVNAVLREWSLRQGDPAWDLSSRIDTIYLGGGTPSRLAPAAVAHLLDRIAADRLVDADSEITLEANPDDVPLSAARTWKAAGVNRVSLGVQSFDPPVLRWMHRTHTAEQVPVAVETLRRAGIENLSLDLIFGLPDELQRDWARDLERAFELEPYHLSLYGLTVESRTPLGRWTQRGQVVPAGDESYASEFLAAHQAMTDRGFEHYEVSNGSKPGYRSRHNSAYWRRAPFIGLGPSAHSGFGDQRWWNIRDWAAYERAILAGGSPREGVERLDSKAIQLEELYLALRTCEGLPSDRAPVEVGKRWEQAGWAVSDSGMLRLTPEGWLRLDALVAAAGS